MDGFISPDGLAQFGVRHKMISMIGFAATYVAIMSVRVREEEAMLRQKFGSQWEEWHQRTARFIPGIF